MRTRHTPGAPHRFEEVTLADEPGTRARQEQASGRDDLEGEPIHVAILSKRLIDRFAVTSQLGGVEDNDIETFAVRNDIAKPCEQISLDVANRCAV